MQNNIELYPLTHPQMGIWYLEKFYPETAIGNIVGTVIIKGDIDYHSLEKAVNIAYEKNDAMRFRITEADGHPLQYVSEYSYSKLNFVDLSHEDSKTLEEWSDIQAREPFHLLDSSLFQISLIKTGPYSGGFCIKCHHIVSDAWTMTIVINQILEYYWRLVNQVEMPKENRPSYIEYILKEIEYKNSQKYQKDKEFWHTMFETIPEKTTLANNLRNSRSTKAVRESFIIEPELLSKINSFCNENRISVFTFFLSALLIYISRTTQKKDLTVGTPVLNRSNAREKDTVGMFVNTIPFRIHIDENMNFISFSNHVSKEWRALLRHYRYPYDILLKNLREKHSSLDNLYDIVISYQNAKLNKSTYITEYESNWRFNGNQSDPLYIHISDRESSGSMFLDYDYLESLFTGQDIERVHNGLMALVEHIISEPSETLYNLEIMQENEKTKLLYDFNDTDLDYPDKTVHQIFEEQVQKTPNNAAVVFENEVLTYRELNEKANQLAKVLREKGARKDSIVGIMVNRSSEMIIGIMSILKAGAAYLPIDPDYPAERIKFMLEDSGAEILLTQKDLTKGYSFKGKVITFQDEELADKSVENLESISSSESLAYVIYTSGSTGQPKGVMLRNKGIVNLLTGMADTVGFSQEITVISITTVSFDIFIFETIIPLLKGCKVIIANKDQQRIPKHLNKIILENKADVLQTTPSIMDMFLSTGDMTDGIKRLKTIILGGESFPLTLLEKLRSLTDARIFNGYGPSETTIYSTFKDLTNAKSISIGRPVSNTKVYVLDDHLNLLPIERPGEIYIGGKGVGAGYINRKELTETSFIPNPFIEGEYIYKTGDIGRWLPNGEIECLGRVDHQVKIRGLRIELGEIENRLLQHEQVEKAVVVDREDRKGKKYLCAYIVSKNKLDTQNLRSFLSGQLPVYMIPSYFVRVNEIPLTPNGKVEREKLPEPVITENKQKEMDMPSNEIEVKLTEIWCKALNIDKVGMSDDFFNLGGDSLSIIYVVTSIYKEFKVNISIEDIYKLGTIKEQAEYIKKLEKKETVQISPVETREYYPLSSAQKKDVYSYTVK
jgi:amino acid adenylation domain-containing protein